MEEVSPQIGAWLQGCPPTTQKFLCASTACDITLRPCSHVQQALALLEDTPPPKAVLYPLPPILCAGLPTVSDGHSHRLLHQLYTTEGV